MVLGYPEYEGKHSKKEPAPAQPPPEAAPEPQKEGSVMGPGNIFGANSKAILGFLVTFGGQLLARTFAEGSPVLPDDWQGWLALFGGSLLAAGVIWAKNNNESVDVLQRKLDKAAAKG